MKYGCPLLPFDLQIAPLVIYLCAEISHKVTAGRWQQFSVTQPTAALVQSRLLEKNCSVNRGRFLDIMELETSNQNSTTAVKKWPSLHLQPTELKHCTFKLGKPYSEKKDNSDLHLGNAYMLQDTTYTTAHKASTKAKNIPGG